MGATKVNSWQTGSLVNLMYLANDFENGAYGQLPGEREKGSGSQNEGAEEARSTQSSCVISHDARQPIQTVHYAVTAPVQWRGDLGDWRA